VTGHAIHTRVRHEDWPHGLRCARCSHLFVENENYHKQLHAMYGMTPISLIVCADCAIGVRHDGRD
jgi:hypothetical protein